MDLRQATSYQKLMLINYQRSLGDCKPAVAKLNILKLSDRATLQGVKASEADESTLV